MMGKTHIAVGIAAAYLITQPQTAPERSSSLQRSAAALAV